MTTVEARISTLNQRLLFLSGEIQDAEEHLSTLRGQFTHLWKEKDTLERSLIPPRRLSRSTTKARTKEEIATHIISGMSQAEFDAFLSGELAKKGAPQ